MENKFELFTKVYDVIISFKQETLEASINEIIYIDNKAKVGQWFGEGIALVKLSIDFFELLKGFEHKKPIFIQHIFPVLYSFDKKDLNSDIENLKHYALSLEESLNINGSFSVQSRVCRNFDNDYKKYKLNDEVSVYLESKGYKLNIKEPEQIISVLVSEDKVYIGLSEPEDNLSIWAGGIHRFAKEEGQLSRAEFKLLEVFDYFKIKPNVGGIALDLGAAPGGWSRVLISKGFKVIAVDPANLNEDILKDPKIEHYLETTQKFIQRDLDYKFDIIVNDMKMDASEACLLMGEVKELLKDDGVIITTLKLPKKGTQKKVKKALSILERWYYIQGARQLFHNRCEITVVLKKQIK